jgi:VirE N-terminal domain
MTPYTAICVQRFDDLFDPTPSAELFLADALTAIAQGTYARAIRHVRAVLAQRGEAAYKTAKERLPQITFAGTFAPCRAKANLVQHSELCHADIDHLRNLAAAKQRLITDPCVVYCFTSTGGDGLKYGVRIAPVDNDEAYKHAWGYVAAAHQSAYEVIWDRTGKDICRLCFVSWDPDMYVNLHAQVCDVPAMIIPAPKPRPVYTTTIPRDRREWYAQRGIEQAVRIIEDSVEGGLHRARCKAGYLLGGYVGGGILSHEEAYAALRVAVEGRTKHLGASLKTIGDCLAAGEAKPITVEELEDDWHRYKEAHPLGPCAPAPITGHPDTSSPITGWSLDHTPIHGWTSTTTPIMGWQAEPLSLGGPHA